MNVKRIRSQVSKLKAVAAAAVGPTMRHGRIAASLVGGVLLLTPLMTGNGEVFLLNLAGLGLIALLVRRIAMALRRRGRRGRH